MSDKLKETKKNHNHSVNTGVNTNSNDEADIGMKIKLFQMEWEAIEDDLHTIKHEIIESGTNSGRQFSLKYFDDI